MVFDILAQDGFWAKFIFRQIIKILTSVGGSK